jgi:hypothetical protein
MDFFKGSEDFLGKHFSFLGGDVQELTELFTGPAHVFLGSLGYFLYSFLHCFWPKGRPGWRICSFKLLSQISLRFLALMNDEAVLRFS